MAMTWMETFQLLGLDLLALALVTLGVFHFAERAVHSAWVAMRSRQLRRPPTPAARCLQLGGIKHV